MVKKAAVVEKPRLCKMPVRKGGKEVECKTLFVEQCGNQGAHVMKLRTGFCSNGWCEGTKAKDWRGNPAPTCKFIFTCPCDCHVKLDKLFEMSGRERVEVDSSGYVPPPRTFWLPSDDPLPILSRSSNTTAAVVVESPVPDLVPSRVDTSYTPTPTGRAARGELESWVRRECDDWLIDQPGSPCTPSYLADAIARVQAVSPPSVGAINAVFERWVKLGFATVDKKPTRFTGYTKVGIELGLEGMKARVKREKAQAAANQKRGIR